MYIRLVQDFGLECEVAKHLSESYGDRAFTVAKMASLTGNKKIKPIEKGIRNIANKVIFLNFLYTKQPNKNRSLS